MNLVKYTKYDYINAELISWIGIKEGRLKFTIQDQPECFVVDEDFVFNFLNQIQDIDKNKNNNYIKSDLYIALSE